MSVNFLSENEAQGILAALRRIKNANIEWLSGASTTTGTQSLSVLKISRADLESQDTSDLEKPEQST